ncbi:hypothetical protein [Halostagnicola sp. A-GB9-2]|uniref:hypothetical protein n=1 Tax=Halostagnicola sp. A-GB9-2 TaxID=3048066 RepID=UPI0024BFE7C6|nr:hypothetical protein [Halostagnicola sp. A-GB9-2]MDJ1430883.1 hypothetical protein [Halostagnicola sp. A-GB9-2]
MSRLERLSDRIRDRPVISVFVLFVSVPTVLAVLSFRQPFGLPTTVLDELEFLFRLFVYVPVTAIRAIVFEPLRLSVLFSIPILEQVAVFAALLGFYYLLSLVLVRGFRILLEGFKTASR